MNNKKSYYDPLYVRKGIDNKEDISPTGRLNKTFGKIENEREKEKRREPHDSENTHSRNQ